MDVEETQEQLSRRDVVAALQQKPHDAALWVTLGKIDYFAGAWADAIDAFQQALARDPNNVMAWNGLGHLSTELGNPHDTVFYRRKALACDDGPTQQLNLAYDLFRTEAWQEAWKLYDARHRPRPGKSSLVLTRPFTQPRWQGQALHGTLLIWQEQGIGEEIIFSTMLGDVLARTKHVMMECEARLLPLFQRTWPEVTFVAHHNPPSPLCAQQGVEAQIPAGSLGQFFRQTTDDYKTTRALAPDDMLVQQLRQRYKRLAGDRKLLGISWRSRPFLKRGGSIHLTDPKSVPFSQLQNVLDHAGWLPISVQYGDVSSEMAAVRAMGVEMLFDREIDPLTDLDSAAAQIAAMDAVVCVSNAAAHMAGAMHKNTHVLLPRGRACIHHWHVGRARSLWYPSAQLYRQAQHGDWQEPLEALVKNFGA
ncbi:MAG: hypothetical protein EBQ89_03280 [Alphaproteobacteria bacterium]|nr:hypothetical protein [Alphaproteobacteria bacterium]